LEDNSSGFSLYQRENWVGECHEPPLVLRSQLMKAESLAERVCKLV